MPSIRLVKTSPGRSLASTAFHSSISNLCTLAVSGLRARALTRP
jgi:hypothetical protein